MSTTDILPVRGRPRSFDPEKALATAQQLFHEQGYDALSVADLTKALGINPPSFYAAFGSKAQLFARVLDRYVHSGAVPIMQILQVDRPLAESLAQVLEQAARLYAADPSASGCMVLAGTHACDEDAREASLKFYRAAHDGLRSAIAERCAEQADGLADYVATTMAGLSASARHGQSLERLLQTARLASLVLAQALPD